MKGNSYDCGKLQKSFIIILDISIVVIFLRRP